MNRKIDIKDLLSGLTFVVLGLGFSVIANGYDRGTADQMGPGYFPLALGILLTVIGIGVAGAAFFKAATPDRLAPPDFKILVLIIASVVLFGVALPHLGLVVTTALTVLIASAAGHEFKVMEAVAAALVLILICVVTFIFILKLQIPVWPTAFGP